MELELNQLHELPYSSSSNNIDKINFENDNITMDSNDINVEVVSIDFMKCQKNKVIYIYNIVSHIFVFSLCESLFFWFYIIQQENKAFKNQFNELKMISNLICLNYDIDLSPYYDYLEKENKIQNQVPINYTIYFNSSLFFIVLSLNGIMKMYYNDVIEINKKTYKNIGVLMIFLFAYEFLFFNNVIYNYKPKSIVNINKLLFTQCVDD